MSSIEPTRRKTLFALGSLGVVTLCNSASNATSIDKPVVPTSLRHLENRSFPGGVALVHLGSASPAPQATFMGQRVLVLRPHQSKDWWAVVGIALSTESGWYGLEVQRGEKISQRRFLVEDKKYPQQHITLKDNKYVSPPEKTLKRIERELQEQTAAYQVFSPTTPSNLLFDPPVPGRRTSPFGFQRVFNGQPRNPHSGMDFAAAIGTPVQSPADGKILLIGDFYFNGKTVFIDHGMGLISMFCHLSQIDRQLGESIKRGQTVARVGNTGRSTGPHLHWNVSLNNARVDPALFLKKQKA